ncbi:MAG: hypothetical protein ABI680_08645 [Chthoniobacteraceae bacterium]
MKPFLDRFRRKGDHSTGEVSGPSDLPTESPETPNPQTTATGRVGSQRDESVTFVLGDFLARIPERLLAPGPHDEALELAFDVQDLSARIARGQTTVRLTEIYRRVPEIFRHEISDSDATEIRFPWQKLLDLVKAATSAAPRPELSDAAAESLGRKLRERKATLSEGDLPAEKTAAAPRRSIPNQPSWFNRQAAGPSGSSAATALAGPLFARSEHSPEAAKSPPVTGADGGQNHRDDSAPAIESLRREIEDLRRTGEEKEMAITRERDALLTQKSHLMEQVAQMQKASASRASPPSGEGERLRRESQRQADEFQRRIAAIETNQRETTQELNRERESRIKAERAASAAERARNDAAGLVESIRNDLRRESDNQARKRDAEFARLQQELSERVETLTDAYRKAVSERDELAAEVAALRKAANETKAASDQTLDEEWESRAVVSLEADIENYRARIRALLKERDALIQNQPRDGAGDSEKLSQAEAEITRLKEQLAAARPAATVSRKSRGR